MSPSMLLDEPTILNKERIGQRSKVHLRVRDLKRELKVLLAAEAG